jgi:hypothetical protein
LAYGLVLTRAARKDLDRLPREVLERADPLILALAKNPRPFGSEKLQGKGVNSLPWDAVANADPETVSLGSNRKFFRLIARSRAAWRTKGGLSAREVRRRLSRPAKKRQPPS